MIPLLIIASFASSAHADTSRRVPLTIPDSPVTESPSVETEEGDELDGLLGTGTIHTIVASLAIAGLGVIATCASPFVATAALGPGNTSAPHVNLWVGLVGSTITVFLGGLALYFLSGRSPIPVWLGILPGLGLGVASIALTYVGVAAYNEFYNEDGTGIGWDLTPGSVFCLLGLTVAWSSAQIGSGLIVAAGGGIGAIFTHAVEDDRGANEGRDLRSVERPMHF